jgi:hypothetical protein
VTRLDKEEMLSPAGRARREVMLGELLQTMQQLRRRRQRRRTTASAVIVLGLLAVGLWVTGRPEITRTDENVGHAPPDPPAGAPIRVRVIGDEELLALLEKIGRPAGLIRSEARVWLSSDVTDAALERQGRPQEAPAPPPTL